MLLPFSFDMFNLLSSKPYSQCCKNDGNKTNINFKRVVKNDKTKFKPFEKEQQKGQADAVNYCCLMFFQKVFVIGHGTNVQNLQLFECSHRRHRISDALIFRVTSARYCRWVKIES